MKNTTYTPGPISFDGWFPRREDHLLPCVKATWDGRMIQMFTDDLEQGEVDMRLLQSAPDLLEACKAVLKCNHELGAISRPIADQARAAIAKAEGNA